MTLLVQVHLVNLQLTLYFGSSVTKFAHIPNKKDGGYCLGGKIAPIFFNTMEDAGALPVEIDVSNMNMGDEITLKIDHAAAKVTAFKDGAQIAESELKLQCF